MNTKMFAWSQRRSAALVAGFQSLINQSKSPEEVLTEIAVPYADGVANVG